jgi:FkbM family methyltransferase
VTTIFPNKMNTLTRLKQYLNFSCVVDVGINTATPELIAQFPTLKHYLFEPMDFYFDTIEKNYRGIDYELFSMALSDEKGTLYLTSTSLTHSGIATHSQISNQQSAVDGQKVISCKEVEVKRYDQLSVDVPRNFLLKVDVDGKDLHVLKGFGDEISNAAVIIVETTYSSLSERLAFCISKGFQLFDIIDIIHYGPSLYQCDLVFVRNDLVTDELRPPIQKFDRSLWIPFNSV